MKREYYNRLGNKLEKALKRLKDFSYTRSTRIVLNRAELEDLFLLWREEAIKKWGLVN